MASFVFSIAFAILCLSSFSSTYALNGGFSVELIHRDSPKSPFYNPQETLSQRIVNAFHRSINRVHHFTKTNSVSTQEAQSEVLSNNGEYLMSISLGSPSFNILAIADTGSDLIWTQCKPCSDCYNQTAPLFDPKASRTYKELSCESNPCHNLPEASCSDNNVCAYAYSYGDRSYSNGDLATEIITLDATTGRPVQFPKTIFGCGYSNGGTFNEKGSGIIGLGGGSLSLISQMGSSIDGKFSYCLVPFSSENGNSSKMSFGSDAIVSGKGVQSTPLYSKDPDTFYFLTLEAISVGDQKVDFPGGTTDGNIIIDSGTTLTLFPQDFVNDLLSAVSSVVQGNPVEDPTGTFSLCYEAESNLNLPIITAHFTGADVKLNPINTFLLVSEGVICAAFAPIDGVPIYGNVAQANFLVGYDLEGKTVSFQPTDCTQA